MILEKELWSDLRGGTIQFHLPEWTRTTSEVHPASIRGLVLADLAVVARFLTDYQTLASIMTRMAVVVTTVMSTVSLTASTVTRDTSDLLEVN